MNVFMLRARGLAFLVVLTFWSISVFQLNRFPPINGDEPWILSPGYKFFNSGIYGSDLFTGFYGMDQHYLEFMPLMPLLQGAGSRGWGLGVFQMRFLPVAFGTLLLAVVFTLASKLLNPSSALVAQLLAIAPRAELGADRGRDRGIGAMRRCRQEGAQIGLVSLAHLAAGPRIAGMIIEAQPVGGPGCPARRLQPLARRVFAGVDLQAHRMGDVGRGNGLGQTRPSCRRATEQHRGECRQAANPR